MKIDFKTVLIGVAVAVFVIIILLLSSIVVVPAGYKAVIVSAPSSKDIGMTLDEGWHMNPYYLVCGIELIRYNSQSVEYVGLDEGDDHFGSIAVRSNDNLEIYIDFSVTYNIPAQNVSKVRLQYGDYKHTILSQICRSVPRDVASQYNALDIVGSNRGAVERSINENITARLRAYDLIVEQLSIRDIRPPDSVSKAIEDKKVAEQNLITANYQALTTIRIAEGAKNSTIIAADAAAQATILRATAEANATIINANGSAEAIKLIMDMFKAEDPAATNITAQYLTWAYIQALTDPNSQVKYIIVDNGNGSPILIQPT